MYQSWCEKVKKRQSAAASVDMSETTSPTDVLVAPRSARSALRSTAPPTAACTRTPTRLPRAMRCVSKRPCAAAATVCTFILTPESGPVGTMRGAPTTGQASGKQHTRLQQRRDPEQHGAEHRVERDRDR